VSHAVEAVRLKAMLRALMRRQHKTLQELAEHLDLSLATVKRIFADEEEVDLTRLLAVCDWLGVTLSELAALADKDRGTSVVTYTEEQELFLAADPRYLTFLLLLSNGKSTKEIAETHGLTARSVDTYLRRLEQLGLVRITGKGRAVPVHREAPYWRRRGPLIRAQATALLGVFQHFISKHFAERLALTDSDPDDENNALTLEVTAMSREAFVAMRDEMRAVSRKHLNAAAVDAKLRGQDNLGRVVHQFVLSWFPDAKQTNVLEEPFGPVTNL
jgi:DNA-binding CsgD family transcriptional regulator